MNADQRRNAKEARRILRKHKRATREANREIARIAGNSPVIEEVIDVGAIMRERLQVGRSWRIAAIVAAFVALAAITALFGR